MEETWRSVIIWSGDLLTAWPPIGGLSRHRKFPRTVPIIAIASVLTIVLGNLWDFFRFPVVKQWEIGNNYEYKVSG